jgi:hypothetical protein
MIVKVSEVVYSKGIEDGMGFIINRENINFFG